MIDRTFENLKFKRTYIGGSKKTELQTFIKVQGNNECNWLEYRKIVVQSLDDQLNVIMSWKLVFETVSELSLGFMFFTISFGLIFSTPISIYMAISMLILSIITKLLYISFNNLENKILSIYNFSLDIILKKIKEETGFVFDKN